MERHTAFSLVRLGDGEVQWMLEMQECQPGSGYRYVEEPAVSVEVTRTVNGMEPRHFPRFVAALEEATYLDYCDSIPNVRRYLPQLKFERKTKLYRNATAETSNIIFEWAFYELGSYARKHRCLFAGAEAALLEKLWESPAYREHAAEVLPADAQLYFHQVREDGRRYSENLDLIKSDLKEEIRRQSIDTLFLSLGTGAKVLCHEVAREAGIRVIDFGSMLRALTYSGSPGYQACRDMHNPYLFRVPPAVFFARAGTRLSRAKHCPAYGPGPRAARPRTASAPAIRLQHQRRSRWGRSRPESREPGPLPRGGEPTMTRAIESEPLPTRTHDSSTPIFNDGA
jgi:hypothetical protein